MKYLVKYKGNDTIAILIACHTNSKLKILTIENNSLFSTMDVSITQPVKEFDLLNYDKLFKYAE